MRPGKCRFPGLACPPGGCRRNPQAARAYSGPKRSAAHGALDRNSEQAPPPPRPSLRRGGAQSRRRACSGSGVAAHEGLGIRVPAALNPHGQDAQALGPTFAQLRVARELAALCDCCLTEPTPFRMPPMILRDLQPDIRPEENASVSSTKLSCSHNWPVF